MSNSNCTDNTWRKKKNFLIKISQDVMNLIVYSRQYSKSSSSCFSFPNSRIKVRYHHIFLRRKVFTPKDDGTKEIILFSIHFS